MTELYKKNLSEACQSIVWLGNYNGKQVIFKMSKSDDYVAEHETTIANELNKLNHFNLVKFIGNTIMYSRISNDTIPQQTRSNEYCLEKLVTIWEFIDGKSLADFITDQTIQDLDIVNCMFQIYLFIFEFQERIKFVHGDLHTGNVRIAKCEKNQNFVYNISGKKYEVENLGYIVKIIDFGNTMIWSQSPSLSIPLYSYNVGDVNLKYDYTHDLRIFTDAISKELWNNRDKDYAVKFRKFYENFFSQFINSTSKNEDGRIYPLVDIYLEFVENINEIYIEYIGKKKSQIIETGASKFLDLFLPLIKLPVEPTYDEKLLKLEGNEIDKWIEQTCLPLFRKDGTMHVFIKKWLEFEKFLTLGQAIEFAKSIVIFANLNDENSKNIEDLFFMHINDKINSFGINKITLTKKETSLLYYNMVKWASESKKILNKLCSDYYTCLKIATDRTELINKNVFGRDYVDIYYNVLEDLKKYI